MKKKTKKRCDGKFDCRGKVGTSQEGKFSTYYYCDSCWDGVRNNTADTFKYKFIPKPHFPSLLIMDD